MSTTLTMAFLKIKKKWKGRASVLRKCKSKPDYKPSCFLILAMFHRADFGHSQIVFPNHIPFQGCIACRH